MVVPASGCGTSGAVGCGWGREGVSGVTVTGRRGCANGLGFGSGSRVWVCSGGMRQWLSDV
ncbi:hypothetical protein Hanom_Chr11g01015681 [Helianthus anomalus]